MPLTARAIPNTHASVHVTNGFKSKHTTVTNNAKRPLQPTTKPATKETSQTVHIIEVQRFLSTCIPPMDRYLEHFVEFGCNSLDFLRGMSSWAPEKRLAILKKILTRPDLGESAVTEMELAVIENKLEMYFMQEGM